MPTRFYPALLVTEPGKRCVGVVFPDFLGCVSVGDSVQDAAVQAIEALALHVEGILADGDELPAPGALDAPLPDYLDGTEGEITARVLVPVEVPAEREHDGRFRAEVEQAVREADDPAVKRIPHEEVGASWKRQRAESAKRAGERAE